MKKQKRKTKIICTLGPASTRRDVIKKMAVYGMNIARLNFSHGTHREHKKRIDIVRKIRGANGYPVQILQDLEGYRIRIGELAHPVMLKTGQHIFLTQDTRQARNHIPFDYLGDIRAIRKGTDVYVDDGNIALKVTAHAARKVKLVVVFGGLLQKRKGINIPAMKVSRSVFTPKDQVDAEFGIRHRVDYIAQSFVRNKKDIQHVVDAVKPRLKHCKIIAKIENRDGLNNLDEIMMACDGIMIARGDLGVSLPIYQIPVIQKNIIRRCNRKKKMVITATQMLESMTEHSRPTRAEVTDVANAIFDGTDCVMLSAETASGRFPVLSVKTMAQIVDFSESEGKWFCQRPRAR